MYLVQPDIVEYDRIEMTTPWFDLVLDTTPSKRSAVWANQIDTDDLILPIRDITKLLTSAKIEKA
jgi:hypothetical protein